MILSKFFLQRNFILEQKVVWTKAERNMSLAKLRILNSKKGFNCVLYLYMHTHMYRIVYMRHEKVASELVRNIWDLLLQSHSMPLLEQGPQLNTWSKEQKFPFLTLAVARRSQQKLKIRSFLLKQKEINKHIEIWSTLKKKKPHLAVQALWGPLGLNTELQAGDTQWDLVFKEHTCTKQKEYFQQAGKS